MHGSFDHAGDDGDERERRLRNRVGGRDVRHAAAARTTRATETKATTEDWGTRTSETEATTEDWGTRTSETEAATESWRTAKAGGGAAE